MNREELAPLIVALAAAILAWIILNPYGLIAQIAGAFVAFVVIGRTVS